jgi:hypothetical protein
MPPETLPQLLAMLAVYAALGAGTLYRVRRRRRSQAERRVHSEG